MNKNDEKQSHVTIDNALRWRITREIERGIVNVTVGQPYPMRWQTNAAYAIVFRLIPAEIFIDPFLFDSYVGRENLRFFFLNKSNTIN
jgi:hypothetical protein